MKYFIDFEATQFSEEIISVGCVREDGETFYSLVAPVKGKITPFITNLTGITEKVLEKALPPDFVFELFYDWVFKSDELPEFFAWGNSDIDFLRHTFKRTTSQKARMAIGYMTGSLQDYAKAFCKLSKIESCSLIKAYNTLIDEEKTQNHNALDDAMLLFEIYNHVGQHHFTEIREIMQTTCQPKKVKEVPVEEEKPLIPWNKMNFPAGTICMVDKNNIALKHFTDLEETAAWIMQRKISPNQNTTANIDNIKQRLKHAYSANKTYFGFIWRKVS